MTALSTTRVRLRELVETDADDLMRIFSDEIAMTFVPMAVTRERSVAISAIEWHRENYRRFGYSAWAMSGTGGEFLGIAGLLPHEIGTELFCSIVRSHWGRGYATEVAIACRDLAFQKYKIDRLISIIHPEHTKAIAVARKIGMAEVGMLTYWGRLNRLFELRNGQEQVDRPNTVSERLKVLFVCAMNKQRSVTAERLYRNDPRLEVRSAGVRSEALRRVTVDDLKWADVVFAMEREHKVWIATRFEDCDLPPIEVLDIPDEYECMDPELQQILRMTLDAEFEARTGHGFR